MRKTLLWTAFLASLPLVAIYIAGLVTECGSSASHEIYCSKLEHFSKFYADNIRGHVFAGFLALGGFLLSLKTFIVVNMKQNLYDHPKYVKLYKQRRKLDADITLYGPLKELSDLLYYAISASLLAAIFQMTLGLYEKLWASIICMYACLVATILLFKSLLVIKSNLDVWFEHINSNIIDE